MNYRYCEIKTKMVAPAIIKARGMGPKMEEDDTESKPKAANDSVSPRIQAALDGVRKLAASETQGQDKLEVILDMMKRPSGTTVNDVVIATGWPLIFVERALETLVELYPNGSALTLVNAAGTRVIYKIEEEKS